MKKKRFLFLIILSIVVAQLLLITLISFASPYPASNFLKFVFTLDPYDVSSETLSNMTLETYKYDDNNTYDIIYDSENKEVKNTIIWVHGGAFVGGDSKDVNDYLANLSEEGHTVVSINYTLAPKESFPVQIIEIGNAIKHLIDLNHEHVNTSRFVLGGDSAGAHMALNFVTTQVNLEYQKLVNLEQVLQEDQIKGLILFCGPYDFINLSKQDSLLGKFFFHKIGWAYAGKYNWSKDADLLHLASLHFHINTNFPPVFITDANKEGLFDFKSDAIKLANQFEKNNVNITGVLDYSKTTNSFKKIITFEEAFDYSSDQSLILGHNYQFNLERFYNNDTLEKTDDEDNTFSPGYIILEKLILFLEEV